MRITAIPKFYKYHLGKLLITILMVLQIGGFTELNENNTNPQSNINLIGTNLGSINFYSSQLPFINEFKSSHSWLTQSQTQWNTKEENSLNLDSDGWVKSLDNAEVEYTKVSTLLFRDHSNYPSGKYVVLYDGEGSIEYRLDAKKNEVLSTVGRDVIDVNPSKAGILLTITETDPNQTGDYIKNIRVVHESQESLATTETFNPEFLEKIEPFSTLRFMDWMETNHSEQKEWADRPKLGDARYSEVGAPVEIMVELANQTDTNPWFTMPHQATDDYVTNFATYVRDNLEPELEVYIEYSNEVWNPQFEQSKWAGQQAQNQWSNSNLNYLDWYSQRTTEVVKIWDRVFAQDSERVIGVMSAQSANSSTGQQVLDYNWSSTNLSHEDTGIDAISVAPYFGNYIGQPTNRDRLESWTTEADGGLNKLFQEITQGGLLNNSPQGGALAQTYGNMAAYANLAQQEGLELLAYEGGQHLAGIQGLENNQAITDLFIAANRDPRMGVIYREYLEKWFDVGGDLFVNFSDVESPSKWGSWGTLESVHQDSSPKYDAIIDFLENSNFSDDDNDDNDNDSSSTQIIGEMGRVGNFNHLSQTIQFTNSYDNPVVFALPLSRNGGDPAIARITDIQSNSFTTFLQEPEYRDGFHTKESFSYMVLEAGSWQLGDGSLLEVGHFNLNQASNSNWKNINFKNSFENTPVILSQVQTNNDQQFVRTRQKNANPYSFSLKIEEEEALNKSHHSTETVGWLAMDSGKGFWGDLSYEAGHTGDEVSRNWHTIDFEAEFTDTPHLFASLASYDGRDPAGLRYRNLDSNRVQIMVEEDRSLDSEVNHTTEIVDFLALSGEGNLVASAYNSNGIG